ncbi:MAG: ACT domain-containing protein [Methanobacteriota archaeon]
MAPPKERKPSTAQVVRDYIESHPSIKDCMRHGLINLSALARQIMKETGVTSEEAALIACRRYEMSARYPVNEDKVIALLQKSKIEIRTKVAIITARPSWHIFTKLEKAMNHVKDRDHTMHVIHGSAGVTIITDAASGKEIEDIVGKEDVIKVTRSGLVELVVSSPDVIEETPGIMAYLSGALSSQGINFVEVISCYKETMFVVDETDMMRAFEILNKLTSRA